MKGHYYKGKEKFFWQIDTDKYNCSSRSQMKTIRPQCIFPSKHSPVPFPEFLSVYGILSSAFLCFMLPTFSAQRGEGVLLSWYFCNHVIFDIKKSQWWTSPSWLLQCSPTNSRKENYETKKKDKGKKSGVWGVEVKRRSSPSKPTLPSIQTCLGSLFFFFLISKIIKDLMRVECSKWKPEETKPASAYVQEKYRRWGSVSMNEENTWIANQLMRWTCLDAWKASCLGWEKEGTLRKCWTRQWVFSSTKVTLPIPHRISVKCQGREDEQWTATAVDFSKDSTVYILEIFKLLASSW